jgi:hypothetical protein
LALKARLTGFSLPTLFFLAHVLGLAILFWAITIGRTLHRGGLSLPCLRDDPPSRRSNSQHAEGYMHPRMIAFGGRGRCRRVSAARRGLRLLASRPILVHPTTGLWFCL